MSDDSNKNSFWDKIADIASRVDPIRILHDRYAVTNTDTIDTSSPNVLVWGASGGYSSPTYGAVPDQSTRYGTNYSKANQPLYVSSTYGPYYSATTDTYHYGAPQPNLEDIGSRLDAIEKRLLIVNPEKYLLDKYPDLAVAYEQYKSLEDQYRTYDILKDNKENG
jgi:hypothetical protein